MVALKQKTDTEKTLACLLFLWQQFQPVEVELSAPALEWPTLMRCMNLKFFHSPPTLAQSLELSICSKSPKR